MIIMLTVIWVCFWRFSFHL